MSVPPVSPHFNCLINVYSITAEGLLWTVLFQELKILWSKTNRKKKYSIEAGGVAEVDSPLKILGKEPSRQMRYLVVKS